MFLHWLWPGLCYLIFITRSSKHWSFTARFENVQRQWISQLLFWSHWCSWSSGKVFEFSVFFVDFQSHHGCWKLPRLSTFCECAVRMQPTFSYSSSWNPASWLSETLWPLLFGCQSGTVCLLHYLQPVVLSCLRQGCMSAFCFIDNRGSL